MTRCREINQCLFFLSHIIYLRYKVFVGLNDPKFRSLKRQVPEKYLDVSEDEFETDLFMNLDEQASSVVLKMTKG